MPRQILFYSSFLLLSLTGACDTDEDAMTYEEWGEVRSDDIGIDADPLSTSKEESITPYSCGGAVVGEISVALETGPQKFAQFHAESQATATVSRAFMEVRNERTVTRAAVPVDGNEKVALDDAAHGLPEGALVNVVYEVCSSVASCSELLSEDMYVHDGKLETLAARSRRLAESLKAERPWLYDPNVQVTDVEDMTGQDAAETPDDKESSND